MNSPRSLAIIKLFLLGALICRSAGTATAADERVVPVKERTPQMSYLENDSIRLGVDLNIGGAITYLAPATNHNLNVINSSDWGRQVQLSYYSGPNPFNPPGTKMSTNWTFLGWNPIQSGDCYGHKSVVLAHTNDGHSIYIKLVPMQWPLKNVPGECTCEVWLTLDGPVVKARTRLINHREDHTQYEARTQEMPAVYVNGPYYRLFTYTGNHPYTGGKLTQFINRLDLEKHWTNWLATEHWAAQVNDAGWGLGVWTPDTTRISGGFFSKPGKGGPTDGPTGYLAPNRQEILDHNIVFDYSYELVLGTLDEIRAHALHRADTNALLHWEFTTERHGWNYRGAADTGWPVPGELKISPCPTMPPGSNNVAVASKKHREKLATGQWQIVSPEFFQRTDRALKLVIEAAFEKTGKNLSVAWREPGDQKFIPQQVKTLTVIPDGQMRRYELPLKTFFTTPAALTQLRFDLKSDDTNAVVRLRSVVFK